MELRFTKQSPTSTTSTAETAEPYPYSQITYTNPEGDQFLIPKTLKRELRMYTGKPQTEKDDIHFYLAHRDLSDVLAQKPFAIHTADEQFELPVVRAYKNAEGTRIERTKGTLSNAEWNRSGTRVANFLGNSSWLNFTDSFIRTYFPDVVHLGGGDAVENGTTEELVILAHIKSGLTYADLAETYSWDIHNLPDLDTTISQVQNHITNNNFGLELQAGSNHDVALGGNAGNSTIPLAVAQREYNRAHRAYQLALHTLNSFDATALADNRSTSDVNTLTNQEIPKSAKDDLAISLENLVRAENELRASQTFAKFNHEHRVGLFSLLPSAFKDSFLRRAFNVKSDQRASDIIADNSPLSPENFSYKVSLAQLEMHYPEYSDKSALKDWLTTYVTWDAKKQTHTGLRVRSAYELVESDVREKSYSLADILDPNRTQEQFDFFWTQTRSTEKQREWVARIEYTDRAGLDPALMNFTIYLKELGVFDGVRRFALVWPLDNTDYNTPTHYYDATSDFALALMKLAQIQMQKLHPEEHVVFIDLKHWGYHESTKPFTRPHKPIDMARLINSDITSPFALTSHDHWGTVKRIRHQPFIGGYTLPLLGSPLVSAQSDRKIKVQLQGLSVTDSPGQFAVLTQNFDTFNNRMTEEIIYIDPWQEYQIRHPYSSEQQHQIEMAMNQMAPYFDKNYYTSGVTLPFENQSERNHYLMNSHLTREFDYTVTAFDAIPTQARLVEVGLSYMEVVLSNLELDGQNNPQNEELQAYYKNYEALYWQLRTHFDLWQIKYKETLARIQDWPQDQQAEEIAKTCDDLYQHPAFLHYALISADLASPQLQELAPNAFAVAMELHKALVEFDRLPQSPEQAEPRHNSPWRVASAFVGTYYVKPENKPKKSFGNGF